MLREIYLTLVGRQGDRERNADIPAATAEDSAGDNSDTQAVLKGIRAECRWVCRVDVRPMFSSLISWEGRSTKIFRFDWQCNNLCFVCCCQRLNINITRDA